MYFTTIASGSKGNCTLVSSNQTKILVDAGISAARITTALKSLGEDPKKLTGIFLTHEHTDHIAGVEQFTKKHQVPVYASPKTWDALPFAANIQPELKRVYEYEMDFAGLKIDFCKISHDAAQPVGIIFQEGDKRLGFTTDTGHITNSMLHKLKNLDAIIIEANHNLSMLNKGPYPLFLKRRILSKDGHLSNQQTAVFLNHLLQTKPLKIVLAHLSEVNNTPSTALAEVKAALEDLGASGDIEIQVAPAAMTMPKIYL